MNALLALEVSSPGRPIPAAARVWRTGQVLHAVVVDRPRLDVAALRIGGTEIRARTLLPLSPGEQLTLRVERAADSVALRILATKPDIPLDPAHARARGMRSALPHALRLDAALEGLAAVATGKQAPATRPGASPSGAVLALLANVPRPETLIESGGLRQAVRDSGVFLEARLAALIGQARPPAELGKLIGRAVALPDRLAAPEGGARASADLATDFKAQVLRLLSIATPSNAAESPAARQVLPASVGATPAPSAPAQAPAAIPRGAPEVATGLMRLLEGALQRVQSQQLASLSAREGGSPAWHVELPVRLGQEYEAVKLRVGRDAARADAGEAAAWTVHLSLSPGELGPVHVRVTLRGNTIASTLWAERPETAALMRGHLDELRAGFDGAGFDVGRMQCLDGCPPAARADPPGALLQVQA